MTPECASAWRNYEASVNVLAAGVCAAFEEGWTARGHHEKRSASSVGHGCGESPTEHKPPLCWICGKTLDHRTTRKWCDDHKPAWRVAFDKWYTLHTVNPLPSYTYFCGWKESTAGVSAILQTWLDKQGHERCWYYPDLFNQLAWVLGLTQRAPSELPPIEEFKDGCRRYQAEEYRQSLSPPPPSPPTDRLDGKNPATHGPPQEVELPAPTRGTSSEDAKRLSPATGRKWPIDTALASSLLVDAVAWGERLAAARNHAGITLDALGSKLKPPRTRKDISAMEHGRRGLSVELCAQLADALDCDRLWLAGWTL